ncbi:MAG: hypothetical protein P8Q14_02195 [Vicingaceae bacterium]|nr:hypothetical protein [Vicingaceae bacterium]
MEDFIKLEQEALQIYNMPKNTSNKHFIIEINKIGLVNFNDAIAIIDEVDKLKLPQFIHNRNANLKKYCELRIKSLETLSKAISEGTNKYDEKIEYFNKEIEKVIAKIENS